MAFYTADLLFREDRNSSDERRHRIIIPSNDENYVSKTRELMQELNNALGYCCHKDKNFSIYFTGYMYGEMTIAIALNAEKSTVSACKSYLSNFLKKNYLVCMVEFIGFRECAALEFYRMGDQADDQGYISSWRCESEKLGVDFFENRTFKLDEQLFFGKGARNIKEANKKAEMLMGSQSLYDELERIFNKENEKKYYGNPVHYKVTASNKNAAEEMIHLLNESLMNNKRLISSRITWLHDIDQNCYDEKDLEDVFRSSQGGMVVIEMTGTDIETGNFANQYHDVIEFFGNVISKFQRFTLCVFLEVTGKGGFANALLSRVQEDIDIINIDEGIGDRSAAEKLLEHLVMENNGDVDDLEPDIMFGDKKEFTLGEVYAAYDGWYMNQLRNKKYRAYQNCQKISVETYGKKSDPYVELSEMVGLAEVKRLVSDIIDAANVKKMRRDMGIPCDETSLHMLFTGNPGSAKTSVARLLAEILKKEGVLRTGAFVECGRADLVGKYVGWTAKTVRAKFREASGGILFIDEAYSLLDDSKSYGDEAINTIVQEMENRRDDVIVIFAGYPKKMESFLKSNEGLTSRIAFHLDFPDYKPQELCKIIEFMAKRRGYTLDSGTYDKCLEICKRACGHKDYGNGRFVRNLLEQAEMAQARRIMAKKKLRALKKEDLMLLTADDFDVNIGKLFKEKTVIGFNMQ